MNITTGCEIMPWDDTIDFYKIMKYQVFSLINPKLLQEFYANVSGFHGYDEFQNK